MLLMIDNYDSFTYNLVHYFDELGVDVRVVRNDAISIADIEAMAPTHIVISPGPGVPAGAGISMPAIEAFSGKIPILGVCLGHQCIAEVFGGRIVRAKKIVHGKTSEIHHAEQGVFAGLKSPFLATRYHSLVIQTQTLPDCFTATAWTYNTDVEQDEIMGIRHKALPLEGVQFHPESVMTEFGHELFANFLKTKVE